MKTLLIASLCLLAVPVLAAQPAATSQPTASAVALQNLPDFVAALMPVAESTTSVCIANCWDGSTRTCTGTSCTADDSSCPTVQGNCWSNAEGYKYCPACADCPLPHCQDLDGTWCAKGTTTCYATAIHCRQMPCTCNNNHWVCLF